MVNDAVAPHPPGYMSRMLVVLPLTVVPSMELCSATFARPRLRTPAGASALIVSSHHNGAERRPVRVRAWAFGAERTFVAFRGGARCRVPALIAARPSFRSPGR